MWVPIATRNVGQPYTARALTLIVKMRMISRPHVYTEWWNGVEVVASAAIFRC